MQISIIGCGWLGLPLCKVLVEAGYHVLGSTTSREKLDILKGAGISPVLFKLDPMPVGENFNQLFESELLIINIPPGRKTNPPHFYEEQIKYLKYRLKNSKVERVIFISSTSYYPNTNAEVTTDTEFDLSNGSSEAVVKGELQINQIDQEVVVLRCGGLMGENRIPGRWFSGKETSGASTPVNYIHREDVIRVINHLLKNWPKKSDVFNLVSDDHPTRKQVHEKMAREYGFEPPLWIEPQTVPFKVVKSDFSHLGLKSPLEF